MTSTLDSPLLTASCYENNVDSDNSLSSPLLEQKQRRKACDTNTATNAEHETTTTIPIVKLYDGARRVLWLGLVLGFVVQILSLLSYRSLLIDYDGKKSAPPRYPIPSGSSSISDWARFIGLQLMSKMDLIVYIWIWMVVTISLTRTRFIPRFIVLSSLYCFDPAVSSTSSSDSSASREGLRVARVVGIHCFVGIVLGNLLAWIVMDGWLGFPVPLQPILGVAALDSTLCCLLMWSFRKFVVDRDDEDDEDDEEDASNALYACC